MSNVIYNFSAGPAVLPNSVREILKADLTNYAQTGRSILEISHRSSTYQDLMDELTCNLRTLLNIGQDRTILLLQGGASGQFAMLPYNFLREGSAADYLVRGYWGEKAAQQAARIGRITRRETFGQWNEQAVYAHVTTNETIAGTALPENFECPPIPLCADMSSDILAAPRDYNKYNLFYAGTQKNLGVAGLALVVIENEFLSHARRNLPAAFCYLEHTKANGLYHTPNAFAVCALYRVTQWLKNETLENIWAANQRKATKLYAEIDRSPLWRPLAPKDERSLTNVTFRLPTEDLEQRFLAEAEARGLCALKGHRALGGVRVSIYNAMPEEGVDNLVEFMRYFESRA
jgi:phosphoserine aminotransferase